MSKYYKGNLIFTKDIKHVEYHVLVYKRILDFSSKEFMEKYRNLHSQEENTIKYYFLFYKSLNDKEKANGLSILNDMFKDTTFPKYYSNNTEEVIYEIIVDVDGNLYGKEILTGAIFPIISKSKIEVSDKYNNETLVSRYDDKALYHLCASRIGSLEFKNIEDRSIYVKPDDYKEYQSFLSYFESSCDYLGKNDGLCYKKNADRIDINIGITFPFSNLERGECYIENNSSANEIEINKYKEMHQDKKGLFRVVRDRWKEKIIEYAKMNVFKGEIIPKKEEEKPKRVGKLEEDDLLSKIEFKLIELKSHNNDLYNKYNIEYVNLLNNANGLQTMPINVSLARLLSKIELALELNKSDGANILDYLENKKHEYLEKILNGENSDTKITIHELDKIMELFLKVSNDYDILSRRKIMRNLALLYILELYENKDNLNNLDLENSYLVDNLMTVIVCINSLYELGLIESDLIIDFSSDIDLEGILNIISNMKFKKIDKDDVKQMIKKV